MAKVSFNVDAYTARLIGRENVSKLNGAVIELVKNTYDADASVCVLYYEEKSSCLYLADNGCGMTENIIKNNWMTIGRSTKKINFLSSAGRTQTGAKGIGRFALDRISDTCEMFTSSKEGGLIWHVNWDDFSKSTNITDVTAELYIPKISILDFIKNISNDSVKKLLTEKISATGTIFKLTNLRDNWDEEIFKKIKNDLATLIPYELRSEFQVYIFNKNTVMDDAEVLNVTEAFSYDYKVEFNVTDTGQVSIKIHRNEFDFGNEFEDIMESAAFSKQIGRAHV